ncbi:WYL domain-containing protein [Alkalihalobacillus sp. LMS6]|uniref:helix-turn-helix transcriptional regulator n=1 Tax=Alkalihalobacillus sp. LMS6 TaxID=2924034 RepID=UPI0020D07D54|nr:WYL domain-containing protein [Alkalihalobacillus sp. LMS6]UTR06072.1 WYL domain-containing protein [Alkalihalobacillus sp. LMS6]
MSKKVDLLLKMYDKLIEDGNLDAVEFKKSNRINERTFRRYLDELRLHLQKDYSDEEDEPIKYNRHNNTYQLQKHKRLLKEEVLVITKILLESRAFKKVELDQLVDSLINFAYKQDEFTLKKLIANEQYNYIALSHGRSLIELIWELNNASKKEGKISFLYERADGELKKRVVKPVGLLFSEYYFYLAAHIENKDYDYPTIFRVDRISDVSFNERSLESRDRKRPDVLRFQEGIYRQQIAFMQTGDLLNIELKCKSYLSEVIRDKLPAAEITSIDAEYIKVRAKVFGKGIEMWLLSQGQAVEVIKPQTLRSSIISKINEMKKIYE